MYLFYCVQDFDNVKFIIATKKKARNTAKIKQKLKQK